MKDFAVKRQRFYRPMRCVKDRAPGGLIDTSRFHADVAIFHDIDPPNAMRSPQLIELRHQGGR